MKNGYFIGKINPTFSDKPISKDRKVRSFHLASPWLRQVGTAGAMQVPVVGLQPLRSVEQPGPLVFAVVTKIATEQMWMVNMGVSENVVYPIVPNGFADHYPYEKWLFHWEYTIIYPTFSDKPTCQLFTLMMGSGILVSLSG